MSGLVVKKKNVRYDLRRSFLTFVVRKKKFKLLKKKDRGWLRILLSLGRATLFIIVREDFLLEIVFRFA